MVRSDDPARLSPAGWSALRAHGVRTIVDLRNDGERSGPVAEGAAGLATVHVPMDDLADAGPGGVLAILEAVDVEACLRGGGLGDHRPAQGGP